MAYFLTTRSLGPGGGEVTGVAFASDEITLSWNSLAGATSYDVARGGLLALRSSGLSTAADFDCGVGGTSTTDTAEPVSADGFYYLVRGRDGSGPFTWGHVDRDGVVTACP
jgi:hypothetical protein